MTHFRKEPVPELPQSLAEQNKITPPPPKPVEEVKPAPPAVEEVKTQEAVADDTGKGTELRFVLFTNCRIFCQLFKILCRTAEDEARRQLEEERRQLEELRRLR